jgi:ornithine decarboxylase
MPKNANAVVPQVPAKIEEFFRTQQPQTPCVVIDTDTVAERYTQLATSIPSATVYYAVKANPALPILRRIHELGSKFDVASPGEIDFCLSIGVDPKNISYGNTIKKRADIAYAASVGVHRYTIDSNEELDKIASIDPTASVCVRLRHDCGGADWPLSRKFGAPPEDVVHLLVRATELGMVCGVSFHVGSQQRDLGAWDDTLEIVADVFSRAKEFGGDPSFLNLGGGLPGIYREGVPTLEAYSAAVNDALAKHFPADVHMLDEVMIEPGRYMVADAGVLRTEVVLVSRRSPEDTQRWVYLDCGKFHGLAETMDEAIRYRIRTSRDGGMTGPVAIAGPTCDSADVLYEKTDYELPLDLTDGDFVDILSTGAYTTTYSSIGFNGFAPLAEYCV